MIGIEERPTDRDVKHLMKTTKGAQRSHTSSCILCVPVSLCFLKTREEHPEGAA
jgi:hypothetical protein